MIATAILQKRATMRKQILKDMLYSTLLEMTKNKDFYYKSNIGKNHDYDMWRESGIKEREWFIESMTKQMLIAEDEEFELKVKEMTFEKLKATK